MSKKRPREAVTSEGSAAPTFAAPDVSLETWSRRVFKNSYTYRGRLRKVNGWSVKIQHQRLRRTFSLRSSDRLEAAQEAAQLYLRIVTQGWPEPGVTSRNAMNGDADAKAAGTRSASESSGYSERYWEQRLLQRPYPLPRDAQRPDWAVRLEHSGLASFFPLGTDNRKLAAKRAAELYSSLVQEGWEAVQNRFPREITIGLHWAMNPVVWSYTTIHTEVARHQPLASEPNGALPLKVVIVESDTAIRRALHRWLNANANAVCTEMYGSIGDALQRASPAKGQLWLLNRALNDGLGSQCLKKLRQMCPDLAGVIYSVFEDSNQLFLGTPGGASGYHLRRTSPEKLLEPLAGGFSSLSAQSLPAAVKTYFQVSLTPASSHDGAQVLEQLTRREQEILQLLTKGHVDKEIAARLGISAWTVHSHVKHIFEKLNVHTRSEAVAKCLQK